MSAGVLEGKVVALTGGTRGLGWSFACALGAGGAAVVLNGSDQGRVDQRVEELRRSGVSCVGVAGSVAEDEVSERIVRAAVDEFGRLDVFVANAGIARDRTLLKATPEEFDETIAVNLRGAWSGGRHAARVMRSRGGGLIVLIASGAAFMPTFGQSSYAASKAGVLGLMHAWHHELARYGVRVLGFGPSAATEMTQERFEVIADRSGTTAEQAAASAGFGPPERVAPVLVHLCSDEASHLRGELVRFDGTTLQRWGAPALLSQESLDEWGPELFRRYLS